MHFGKAFNAADTNSSAHTESIPLECKGLYKSANLSSERVTPSPLFANNVSANNNDNTNQCNTKVSQTNSGPTVAIIRYANNTQTDHKYN